ncbi:type IV secretion protein Rhs [Dyella flava]|nr:type IV secretion protein Rhs [Dyella flava]
MSMSTAHATGYSRPSHTTAQVTPTAIGVKKPPYFWQLLDWNWHPTGAVHGPFQGVQEAVDDYVLAEAPDVPDICEIIWEDRWINYSDGTYKALLQVYPGIDETGFDGFLCRDTFFSYPGFPGYHDAYILMLESPDASDPTHPSDPADTADTGENLGSGRDCDGGVGDNSDESTPSGSFNNTASRCRDGAPMEGDPINLAIGNKFQQDTDLELGPWLTFRRFYNSNDGVISATLGAHWRHSFDRFVQVANGDAGQRAIVTRPDGKRETFTKQDGWWTTSPMVSDVLVELEDADGKVSGYSLFVAGTRQFETYSLRGFLESIHDESGQSMSFRYSVADTPKSRAPASGLLLTATDPYGRSLAFYYDDQKRVSRIVLPDRGAIEYGYDASNNLSSVRYPDGKGRSYRYDTQRIHALVAVIDEAGERFEETNYDERGRATKTSFAGSADETFIYYNEDGSASLQTPLGAGTDISFTNAFGRYQVSASSRPCSTQCRQPWKKRTYDTLGYPATYTDFNGGTVATRYNEEGLLEQLKETKGTASERTTTWEWDSVMHVPTSRTVSDAADRPVSATHWRYNANGQTIARCDVDPTNDAAAHYSCADAGDVPGGVRRWTYSYCTATDAMRCPLPGLLLAATGPRTDLRQTTRYSYYLTSSAVNCSTPGAACFQAGDLHTVTDALGHVTTIVSYDINGRINRIMDANGVTIDLTYTPRGWLASRTIGGATTNFTYTPYGAVQTITDPDGAVTTYSYDKAHRLTKVTDPLGNHVQYTLDLAGNRIVESTYAKNGQLKKSIENYFNSRGQLFTALDGLQNEVFSAPYDNGYDANGNLVWSWNAQEVSSQHSYDALNRRVQTINTYVDRDNNWTETRSTFNIDTLDRLDRVVDPDGLATTYAYDGLDNLIQHTSPDSGTTTNVYDSAGNLTQSVDARSIARSYTYDALNRVTSFSTGTASDAVTYVYDEPDTLTGCTGSYPLGRLTRVVETAVTTSYCYDARGAVIAKHQTQGAHADITLYAYTPAGRLRAITQPTGNQISYTRNEAGQVTAMTVTPPNGAPTTVISDVTYLPFGPIASYKLGNGHRVTRDYDANYRLTDVVSNALSLRYTRNVAGQVTRLTEGDRSGAFTYDKLGRLTEVRDANSQQLESYSYSKAGDRLSKIGGGLATGTYRYAPNTHWLTATGTSTRHYDLDGNTSGESVAGETWGYEYDGRNRVAAVRRNGSTVATYSYNAFGERVAKTVALPQMVSARFIYNEQSQLIAERGSTDRDYLWLGTLPVAVIDLAGQGSSIGYVIGDELGTPRAVEDAHGNTLWSWSVLGSPFGEHQPNATTGYVYNLRFPGQYFDVETGLHYNIQRHYDPAIGRYRQVDPLSFAGGQWSLYGYVGADPLSATDPTGEFGLVGAAIGAAVELGLQAAGNYMAGNDAFDVNNYNWTDVGIAAAASAIAPGWGAVAKTAKTSGQALKTLTAQLEGARAAARVAKLESRIANHQSAIADVVGTQLGVQGVKTLAKWASHARENDDCP